MAVSPGCLLPLTAPSTEQQGGAELSLSWDRRWALLTLGVPEALPVTPPYRQHLEEPAELPAACWSSTGAWALCPLCGFVPCAHNRSCPGWSCTTPFCLLPFARLLLPKSLLVMTLLCHFIVFFWDEYLLFF